MSSERSGRQLFDAAAMRAADDWAIGERGIPSLALMERAGAALSRMIESEASSCAVSGPIRIVCGKGNNWGDGFVAARLLREAGHDVDAPVPWSD